MSKKYLEKSTLNKMFFRSMMYGASWNYERMQNLGFCILCYLLLKKYTKMIKNK